MGQEGLLLSLNGQFGVQAPVLLGNKGVDLLLPVPDHTQGNGLDSARGQAPFDFCPEQGGDPVADHTVQDPAGLLGIDQVHVDLPGILQGFRNCLFGDLVEGDPVDLLVLEVTQLEGRDQMPGNGLSFAVRVGRQIDPVGLFDHFPESGQELALAADGDIFGFIIVVKVDSHLALGHIAHMAVAGRDFIIGAKEFLDGLHLGGRLHDDKILLFLSYSCCHNFLMLLSDNLAGFATNALYDTLFPCNFQAVFLYFFRLVQKSVTGRTDAACGRSFPRWSQYK